MLNKCRTNKKDRNILLHAHDSAEVWSSEISLKVMVIKRTSTTCKMLVVMSVMGATLRAKTYFRATDGDRQTNQIDLQRVQSIVLFSVLSFDRQLAKHANRAVCQKIIW